MTRIEVILSEPPAVDRGVMQLLFRQETGKRLFSLGWNEPEKGSKLDSPRLAEQIRKAVARGATALCVEPLDAPEVRSALEEARSAGVSILLLDRPFQDGGLEHIPTILSTGYPEGGRRIVEAAFADEKALFPEAKGIVVLLRNQAVDRNSKIRWDSLEGPVKAAGRKLEVVSFQGDDKAALQALEQFLKGSPRVTVILTEEDSGMTAALGYRKTREVARLPLYVLAGYSSKDLSYDSQITTRIVGYVDRNPEGYARTAFNTLSDMIGHKPVPERIVVGMPFHREPASLTPGLPETK